MKIFLSLSLSHPSIYIKIERFTILLPSSSVCPSDNKSFAYKQTQRSKVSNKVKKTNKLDIFCFISPSLFISSCPPPTPSENQVKSTQQHDFDGYTCNIKYFTNQKQLEVRCVPFFSVENIPFSF